MTQGMPLERLYGTFNRRWLHTNLYIVFVVIIIKSQSGSVDGGLHCRSLDYGVES